MLALAGSGSTTWAGGRDQKLVGRAGQTVAVSGCPLSSMSPPPQAGSEGREKPCPTRPGPTRPGPGPPPSPHPLSRPRPAGGVARASDHPPPRGPRSRGGKNAKPKHLQNARTHASTRTQTRVRWWGAGVEREATMPLSPSPFPPPGADDVPRLQNLPRVERGAQWPCNSAVQQAPPCNRRPPKEREASRGQGLRGVGADRGGSGGAHSDFQVDDQILTMGFTEVACSL